MKLTPLSAAVLSVLAAKSVHAESDISVFEEVVVTANQIEQPLSKVAGSVAVITGEELETKSTTELYDALRNEPGVSVTGGAGRPQNIIIRGMTGNRVTIIRDGIRSADGFGANDINDAVGRDSFDLSNIESLEIVKGASSSVHGSGALGGAVILKSKKPSDFLKNQAFYADISGTYTDISNKYKGTSTLAFRSNDGLTESLVHAAYWQGEESRNFNSDNYNRDLDGYSGAYTINHFFDDEMLFKAHIDMYAQNQERLEGSNSIQKDGNWSLEDFYEDETSETYSAYIGAEVTPIEPVWFEELDSILYWRHTEVVEDINRLMWKPDQNGVISKRRELDHKTFSDETIGFRADFIHTISETRSNHQLAFGIDFSTDYYQRLSKETVIDWRGSTPDDKQPFAPAREYNLGLYFRDMVEMGSWTFTAGLRFDAHSLTPDEQQQIGGFEVKDLDSSELSPSLSIAREIVPNNTIYFSYDHGYRAPEYDKAYGYVNHDFVPLTPFVIAPNLDLKAETSDSFEVGNKFNNGQAHLYISAFYNKFENFIDAVMVGRQYDENGNWTGNYIRQFQNLDGVETYGAELSSGYVLNPEWDISANLGYVDGKDADGDYIRTITPLEGSVQVNYTQNNFNAYALLSWAGAMNRVPECETDIGLSANCSKTDAWQSLDIGASYHVSKNLRLSATVINLTDEEYVRYQSVAGTVEHDKHYSTEPGRYFTFNAKYKF